MKIIPTIFAHNKKEFTEQFEKLLPISKSLQIDFMDGKFVPAKSVALNQIPNLSRLKHNFEAHLMVKNPIRDIKSIKQKGFAKIIFHIESYNKDKMIEKTISLIKSQKMEVFIALNPETPLSKILPFVEKVNGILFMGVNPGREHQSFIPDVYKKIAQLRSHNKKIPIQVDGGATPEVIKRLVKLEVNAVNSGSYISESKNPKETYKELTSFNSE